MKNPIAILLILTCTRNFACDCEWAGNFLEMASTSEVVALVKVKKYNNFFQFTGGLTTDEHQQPLSATFEIVELLRGDEQRTVIEVFGDPGNLCRPYIDYLKDGSYYVVALNKSEGINHGNGIIETQNDYFLWNCGEYWISYDSSNNKVQGRITARQKIAMKLDFFHIQQKFGDQDFNQFLRRFNQDSIFQLSRVRFPHEQTIIDGHEGGEVLLYYNEPSEWTLINLEYKSEFKDGFNLDFKQDTIRTNQTITIKQVGKDSSTNLTWSMEFTFSLINKKWYLTSSKDLSY